MNRLSLSWAKEGESENRGVPIQLAIRIGKKGHKRAVFRVPGQLHRASELWNARLLSRIAVCISVDLFPLGGEECIGWSPDINALAEG